MEIAEESVKRVAERRFTLMIRIRFIIQLLQLIFRVVGREHACVLLEQRIVSACGGKRDIIPLKFAI